MPALCSPMHRVFILFRGLVSFSFQIDFQEYTPRGPWHLLHLVTFPFTPHSFPITSSPSSCLGAFRIRHLSEVRCDFAGFSFLISTFSVTGFLSTPSFHLLWWLSLLIYYFLLCISLTQQPLLSLIFITFCSIIFSYYFLFSPMSYFKAYYLDSLHVGLLWLSLLLTPGLHAQYSDNIFCL